MLSQAFINNPVFDNVAKIGFANLGAIEMNTALATGVPDKHLTVGCCALVNNGLPHAEFF